MYSALILVVFPMLYLGNCVWRARCCYNELPSGRLHRHNLGTIGRTAAWLLLAMLLAKGLDRYHWPHVRNKLARAIFGEITTINVVINQEGEQFTILPIATPDEEPEDSDEN